jgi:hypothetical protein
MLARFDPGPLYRKLWVPMRNLFVLLERARGAHKSIIRLQARRPVGLNVGVSVIA